MTTLTAAPREPPDLKLVDEPGRVAALQRYGVLDSPRDAEFDSITHLVSDLLDVPICAVSLIDDERQWFKSIHGLDVTETPRGVAFCDHTIRRRSAMVVPDATVDERFAANPLVTGQPFIRSYAGAQLSSADGYNLGALCAIDVRPREFTPPQLDLLERFARLVVEQLELRTIAHQDFLTGVLTRRAFSEAVRSALLQRARSSEPLALLTLDIDHFKSVNDRFGHPAGDKVLKSVAAQCQRLLRPGDVIGRIGGEEFAVLLRDADGVTALACAERLRQAIAATLVAGCPPVTASFGIASATAAMCDFGDWLPAADAALYAAKRAGRDRCVVAPATRPKAAAA